MTTITEVTADAPVRKSITVKAGVGRAFRVFTAEMDTWWPRTHHIGKSPMTKVTLEGHAGGRCYTDQEDGTACDWGRIMVWEPPRRFVMAWMINGQWQYEPDAAKSSEVEVTFTAVEGGATRVDLEHRYFNRIGPAGAIMRENVGGPGGWPLLLELFAAKAGE